MNQHRVLIVEDDPAVAEDLAELLSALECDSTIVSNKLDAVAALAGSAFCLIVLDLQIRARPDSIRGHTEQGNALLREIRRTHPAHPGHTYWLPIVVVSGFAREVPTVLDVMKDGASDIIQKPFVASDVSTRIRRVLEQAGRRTHASCAAPPPSSPAETGGTITLAIPGNRERRRSRVVVGSRAVALPDKPLKLLLKLIVAHGQRKGVHKRDLGHTDEQGFKGVSVLNALLQPALGDGVKIITSDWHGTYRLSDDVVITQCDVDKLLELEDTQISTLARQVKRQIDRRSKKSEGKF